MCINSTTPVQNVLQIYVEAACGISSNKKCMNQIWNFSGTLRVFQSFWWMQLMMQNDRATKENQILTPCYHLIAPIGTYSSTGLSTVASQAWGCGFESLFSSFSCSFSFLFSLFLVLATYTCAQAHTHAHHTHTHTLPAPPPQLTPPPPHNYLEQIYMHMYHHILLHGHYHHHHHTVQVAMHSHEHISKCASWHRKNTTSASCRW